MCTEHVVDVSKAKTGDFLSRLWAQNRINGSVNASNSPDKLLEVEEQSKTDDRLKAELLDLSTKYGLVTPQTSMLVLESLLQYVKYEIAPPKMLPGTRVKGRRALTPHRK